MNQPPKKRRWQFSLKVLLFVMTMAGVGMGLIRLSLEFNFPSPFFPAGWFLLTASPGVLIGYCLNRLRGAIFGGLASFAFTFYSWLAYVVFGWAFF